MAPALMPPIYNGARFIHVNALGGQVDTFVGRPLNFLYNCAAQAGAWATAQLRTRQRIAYNAPVVECARKGSLLLLRQLLLFTFIWLNNTILTHFYSHQSIISLRR